MATGKRVPTRLHEVRRLIDDLRLDARLATQGGRREFWERLRAGCGYLSLCSLLESTLDLEGDVIECGVYRGGTLLRLARTLCEHAPQKTLYGLDSFQGFPEDRIGDRDVAPARSLDKIRDKFRFCVDTPARLKKIFQIFGVRAELVPGYFSETLPQFRDHKFCFIHLDCDLYASYKECLEVLWDRLVPGGVIVFDEWNESAWPGSTLAIREFFEERDETVQTCTDRQQSEHYIRKLPAAVTHAA